MNEIMYDLNSAVIGTILFVSMSLGIELGCRVGLRHAATTDESAKAHVRAIQASLLGMLALLLGFTFSLALQRFDSRSEAVVEEANAIGTSHLRSELLPPEHQFQAQSLLSQYLQLRLKAGALDLTHHEERKELLDLSRDKLDEIWDHAVRTAENQPGVAIAALYPQAVNEMIDAFGHRDAESNRHVPELVLLLLYATFLTTSAIVGFSAGVDGHRASFVTYTLVALIVTLAFIIIDLDRPRRGLILVSQKAMTDLQATMLLTGDALQTEIDQDSRDDTVLLIRRQAGTSRGAME